MNAILYKKGCVENINNTHVILINEDNEMVRVNKTIYIIWDMCKGVHFDDLLMAIALGSRTEANRLEPSLEHLVNELHAFALLDIEEYRRKD